MATLSAEAKLRVRGEFTERLSQEREPINLTKADLVAAFNAIDTFFEAQKAVINNAFPEPSRSQLTPAQKAEIVALVIKRRWMDRS